MHRLYYRWYRGIVFAFLGLLVSCGTTTPTISNVPSPARQTDLPAYPIAYPAPNTIHTPPPSGVTNDRLDGGSGYPMPSDQIGPIGPTVIVEPPAPELGVVVDQHMRVLSVVVSSAAEEAGIQPGDILQTLDGIAMISHTETVKDRIHTAQPDQSMHLTLTRGAASLDVIVIPSSAHRGIDPTIEPGDIAPTATPVAASDDYL